MTDFDELLRDIRREAEEAGPEAVHHLEALREHFHEESQRITSAASSSDAGRDPA